MDLTDSWLADGLHEAGFTFDLLPLPGFKYRIVLSWKGVRCYDQVRSSRIKALRAAYFTFVTPENDLLDKLTLADRTVVLRVRAEMAAAS